jgi:TPR repeat protein
MFVPTRLVERLSISNTTMRAWLAIGLVGLAMATSASYVAIASAAGADIQELSDGLLAYTGHETLKALKLLLPLAEKGNPLAQMIVARLYAQGESAPHDCGEAVKWFTRSAEKGNAEAQFELGAFYNQGQCVTKDDRAALVWFEISAEQGESRAPNAIGEIYLGRGNIPMNYAKAIDWFLRGANRFDGDALFNLGVRHTLGQGVPKDYLEAYKWFDLSADFFGPGGDRGKAIRARDTIREDMMPAQVAEAAQRAKKWLTILMRRPHEKKY